MIKKLPKRTNAQKIGSKSQDLVSEVFTEFCNVIPTQDKDLGIDFNCELMDDEFPTGKWFGIQCKGKSEVKDLKDHFSIQIKSTTLNYWSIHPFPVFLIVVDNKKNTFYWTYPKEQIKDLTNLPNKKSIKIKKKDKFDISLKKIPEKMKFFIDNYFKRFVKYPSVLKKLEETEKINILLSENTNSTIGISNNYFNSIHIFLDKINYSLDHKFNSIKKILYEDCWKIGLAYHQFEDNKLIYNLYPIPSKMNDVQIKEVDDKLKEKLKKYSLRGHFQKNPIIKNPKSYAVEFIESRLFEILENKFLLHTKNLFLINEFIIAFIDKFRIQLGLEEKNEYNISDIKFGFYNYLPIWIDEVMQEPNIVVGRMEYISPDFLLSQLFDDKRIEIAKKVEKRLKNKDYNKNDFVMGDNKIHMRLFVEFLENLDKRGISIVKRVYIKKDFSRLGKVDYVWNVYSLNNLEKNLKIFFENLPGVFDDIVTENFPKLKEEVHYFKGFNKLIIIFEGKEKYQTSSDSPKLKHYCIINPKEKKPNVKVYREGTKQIKEKHTKEGMFVQIDNKTYKLNSFAHSVLNFMFDDTPMLNYVYELLMDDMKKYFEIIKSQIEPSS